MTEGEGDYSHRSDKLAVKINAKRILVKDPEEDVDGNGLQHRNHSLLIRAREFGHHAVSFHFYGTPDEGAGRVGFGGVELDDALADC